MQLSAVATTRFSLAMRAITPLACDASFSASSGRSEASMDTVYRFLASEPADVPGCPVAASTCASRSVSGYCSGVTTDCNFVALCSWSFLLAFSVSTWMGARSRVLSAVMLKSFSICARTGAASLQFPRHEIFRRVGLSEPVAPNKRPHEWSNGRSRRNRRGRAKRQEEQRSAPGPAKW